MFFGNRQKALFNLRSNPELLRPKTQRTVTYRSESGRWVRIDVSRASPDHSNVLRVHSNGHIKRSKVPEPPRARDTQGHELPLTGLITRTECKVALKSCSTLISTISWLDNGTSSIWVMLTPPGCTESTVCDGYFVCVSTKPLGSA